MVGGDVSEPGKHQVGQFSGGLSMTTITREPDTTQEWSVSAGQGTLFEDNGDDRRSRTRNSMLWAAYGDALGFVSELASVRMLQKRTGGKPLDRLMDWERRVGGRAGVTVRLPAGCWSDDTQFRLAVSRSISHRGFDVATFAGIELPVWPSYALGGGRASKAAARNLAKPTTLWYANTFPHWFRSGGNGAAMRIQPHVWASADLDDFYTDVLVDSVCTHGHLRAVVGACFHAATLAHCLKRGAVPDLNTCIEIAGRLNDTVLLIEKHEFLGSTWAALWEEASRKGLRDEWEVTVTELQEAIERADEAIGKVKDTGASDRIYRRVCDALGLRAKHQRGSGVLTTVAAAALAAVADNPHDGVVAAANAVGADTDTIATMVGALLGACYIDCPPPEDPLDRLYLLNEADRLVDIALGRRVPAHPYPDLLTWVAPKAQADALVSNGSGLRVEGLGPVSEIDIPTTWTPRRDFGWQWVRTGFGQTLLIKRRSDIRSVVPGNEPPGVSSPPILDDSGDRAVVEPNSMHPDHGVDIDRALAHVRRNLGDDERLGFAIRQAALRGSMGEFLHLARALRDELRHLSSGPVDPPRPPRS